MELHQKIIDYIEEHLEGVYAPVLATPVGEGMEGISATIAPSRYEQKFLDGAVYDTLVLQITAKSTDSILALDTLGSIANLLERAPKYAITSESGAFCFDKCQVNNNPYFAYMDKNQTYVFVSMVKIYFFRKIERGE